MSHATASSGKRSLTGNETTPVTYMGLSARVFAFAMTLITFAFLTNNYLIFWQGWPGTAGLFSHLQWFGYEPLRDPLDAGAVVQAWAQWLSYPLMVVLAAVYVLRVKDRCLHVDGARLSTLAAYIVRACFWAVLLVGVADGAISFLRVEEALPSLVGQTLTQELGRPNFRGEYVHLPLILLSFGIAAFVQRIDFIWLSLLVVFAEFLIVISRFVFSYEQAFMADLVRFWYAALFLFASAFALIEEGHVRVDVFYARFGKRGKAWANTLGCLLLGLPLCWVILVEGASGKGASIVSPLLSYEISQSGFGMYVKYLMAAFLLVFAVSMIIQFSAYILEAVADLRDEPGEHREYDPLHLADAEIGHEMRQAGQVGQSGGGAG